MADTPKKLRPADVCDLRRETVRICDPLFNDYGARVVFQGTIVTISTFEDNTKVREVLASDGTGKVLVVDGGGSRRHALMGGDVAELAATSHWEGVVFNGCIRDAHEIAEKDVGIKALGINPRPPLKKGRGEVDIPVRFAGVDFGPGEYLYADGDGIAVLDAPVTDD